MSILLIVLMVLLSGTIFYVHLVSVLERKILNQVEEDVFGE